MKIATILVYKFWRYRIHFLICACLLFCISVQSQNKSVVKNTSNKKYEWLVQAYLGEPIHLGDSVTILLRTINYKRLPIDGAVKMTATFEFWTTDDRCGETKITTRILNKGKDFMSSISFWEEYKILLKNYNYNYITVLVSDMTDPE